MFQFISCHIWASRWKDFAKKQSVSYIYRKKVFPQEKLYNVDLGINLKNIEKHVSLLMKVHFDKRFLQSLFFLLKVNVYFMFSGFTSLKVSK
jgi:hypothetical protein